MKVFHSIVLPTMVVLLMALGGCGGGGSSGDSPFVLCGNGHLDAGETCDDGNTLDSDDCLSTCVRAVCGDGFIDLNNEECDGAALRGRDCSSLGLAAGRLTCSATCRFDTSQCGPAFTPTPTIHAINTPTPTATATPLTRCGNGVLESGETCDACLADCLVSACSTVTPGVTVSVSYDAPDDSIAGLTVLVGYRSSVVNLPGSGSTASVAARVRNKPSNSITAVNDLDYALRVVLSRANPIPLGRIFTVDFDACDAAPSPCAADFGCMVEGCANRFGRVDGCTCVVTLGGQ
jgi:cysteine-rich repeat protein